MGSEMCIRDRSYSHRVCCLFNLCSFVAIPTCIIAISPNLFVLSLPYLHLVLRFPQQASCPLTQLTTELPDRAETFSAFVFSSLRFALFSSTYQYLQ